MDMELAGLLGKALGETLYMVLASAVLAAAMGIPLGVILVITRRGHVAEHVYCNRILGGIVNGARSVPFIILMVALIPLTRCIAGTSIGMHAAVVPLSLAAIPFLGRIVETALLEVDRGVIEAAQSMGASPWQIIVKVLIPEAWHSIVLGLTIMVVSLIGSSAMAGAIGGGGLGDLAIRYGYQRFREDIMAATVVVLIILVQLIQSAGQRTADRLSRKS